MSSSQPVAGGAPAARPASGERSLDVASALREARARGLPVGWKVSIDKRNRRKWTAPNGRSCDSIPKALAMSVELGMLPADTVIVSGKNKKRKDPPSLAAESSPSSSSHLPALLEAAAVANAQPPFAPLENVSVAGDVERGTIAPTTMKDSSGSMAPLHSKRTDRRKPPHKPKSSSSGVAIVGGSKKSKGNKVSTGGGDDDDEDEKSVPLEPMNPETALNPDKHVSAPPRTVHWDPHDRDGNKVGWKIRIQAKSEAGATNKASVSSSKNDSEGGAWLDGRITRYDPYYHKHKIEFTSATGGGNGKGIKQKQPTNAWIWLRNREHNIRLATQIVWARVKGYAWWPAVVIESNDESDHRPGSVHVEFFGSEEVAWLKETTDTVRPFSPDEIDPIVAKHKKKRNAKAFELACEEFQNIRSTRNEAVVFFAERAIELARRAGKMPLVAKRIQLHRHDINYPYGETLKGKVRAYSPTQKKWLVSYEMAEKSKVKYDACYINLLGKDVSNLQVLTKSDETTIDDLVPFVYAYETVVLGEAEAESPANDELSLLLKDTCRGCVEYWKKGDIRINCDECDAEWHLGCFDPPITLEAWQKLVKDGSPVVCARCTPCRGCYHKDIVFGCLPQPKPPTLSFSRDESLDLCYSCMRAYADTEYCSNCAHTYNAEKLDKVTAQLEAMERKRKLDGVICDSRIPLILGSFAGDDVWSRGAKVDPSLYYPETSEWGHGEKDMLVCDKCDIWIHAGCAGIDEKEYDEISDGRHPVFSKEFLCRVCCRQRCAEIIEALQEKDAHMLFTNPVTEKEAPNYFDVIKMPMDLDRMREKAHTNEYLHYAWVREDFELMVLNALIFNRYYTLAWREAGRYHSECMKTVFKTIGKAAPPSKHASAIEEQFRKAEEAKKNEESRVQIDESVEKKDLVAGTDAVTVVLPELRKVPPDQASCIPFTEVKLRLSDGFFCSWMDCCYTCGSSGAMDCLIFCCECGESFHTFCVNAPIHSMDIHSFNAWRCPSCKVCEISGQVPEEETSMLFCEMCDRAFTLDLLDPPLKAAPPGLWICGQCVDCKICSNTSEDGGASLTHWSRDPELCFRCGGCDGIDCDRSMQCLHCSKFLRESDADILTCVSCQGRVHSSCVVGEETVANGNFVCRSCKPSAGFADNYDTVADWNALSQMAATITSSMSGDINDELTSAELHSRIVQALAWTSREMWRESYEEIIREGLRVLAVATSTYGDPRIFVQHAIGQGQGQVMPMWRIHRAYRFVQVAKRSRWSVEGVLDIKVEPLVQGAKLATSFLIVAQALMHVEISDTIKATKRFATLAEPPDAYGMISLPLDSVWHGAQVEPLLLSPPTAAHDLNEHSHAIKSTEAAITATPLCGWPTNGEARAICDWKDPRACILCGLPGDDDAGFEHVEVSNAVDANLGRLLPFDLGLFVHSGCALWSSETWEDPHDGLIHGVEKARCRGSQLKCFGCGRPGATVGCSKGNCLFNYHYPCAKACGGVFTSDQHLYCINHKLGVTNVLLRENHEPMKALMVAAEGKGVGTDKAFDESADTDLCFRVGALIVHSIGDIETNRDGFHTDHYITPPGYVATRIYWSSVVPKKRTVYVVKVERATSGGPLFTILAGDNTSLRISSPTAAQAYNILVERVRKVNSDYFNTRGELTSKLPVVRRSRRKAHGLNGPQFFGFGLDFIRQRIESAPGVEAVIAPLLPSSPRYQFCFALPSIEQVQDLQRGRAAAKAERALENSSGCARTEGVQAVKTSGGSGRITRALVRRADDDTEPGSLSNTGDDAKARVDRNLINIKYKRMKAIPIEQRLTARRSHIHGWGLFSKMDVAKDQPIVEYMGEIIRQPIADIREKAYEISGEGSCYMFRLDMQRIVDATKTGCLARFMNHSCQPNAYAKIVWVDTETGQDKKIVVFAVREISAGEEITYDYKFPVEDGSLRCTCGAANCIGRLN